MSRPHQGLAPRVCDALPTVRGVTPSFAAGYDEQRLSCPEIKRPAGAPPKGGRPRGFSRGGGTESLSIPSSSSPVKLVQSLRTRTGTQEGGNGMELSSSAEQELKYSGLSASPKSARGTGLGSHLPSQSHRTHEGAVMQKTGQVRAEVEEILRMARGCCWHVVFPTEKSNVVLVGSTTSPPPRPLDVPHDVKAVLLLAELSNQGPAKLIAQNLRKLERQLPPVIVFLLLSDEGKPDHDTVLEAQRAFRMAKADDVVLQRLAGTGVDDLRLAVDMCVERVAEMRAEIAPLQKKVETLSKQTNTLFWSRVHKLFEGFPKLDSGAARNLDVGATLGPYTISSRLGSGSFGEVFMAVNNEDGTGEAVKVVPKDKLSSIEHVRSVWNEFRLLERLDHRGVVQLHGVAHAQHQLYLCMELAGQLNLCQLIRSSGSQGIARHTAQDFEAQIISAIAHCHSRGLAHRDLKPENIAVSEDGRNLKVLDFGCAVELGEERQEICGTMPFMAPEVMAGEPYDPASADVWSCSVILLEMLMGIGALNRRLGWPANVRANEEKAKEIRRYLSNPVVLQAMLEDRYGEDIPKALVEVLSNTLTADRSKRWTSAQMACSDWLAAEYIGAHNTGFERAITC